MSSSKFDNIAPQAVAYAEVCLEIKELEKVKKRLEAEVKPVLADAGAQVFGDYMIEVTITEGRTMLDRKALEASFGDLSRFMAKSKPSLRATVKLVNGGDGE